MKKTSSNSKNIFKFLSTTFAGIALSLSSAQAFTWTGATNSDVTLGSNYNDLGAVPTFGGGASNNGGLFISNGTTNSAFTYAAAQGDTTFTSGNLRIGPNGTSGSTLNVIGGNLTIQSSNNSTIGFQGSGILNVSGGSLSILGSDSILFGNEQAATANISGGTVTIGNTFLFARNGGNAIINLSGNGIFDVTGTGGTSYNAAGGNAIGTINLSGNSLFRQTASSAFALGGNFTVNFASGSAGKLSINGFTQNQFETFVDAGSIKIDGFAADISQFTYSTSGGLGTYQLVPEPGTWAMMALGAVGLLAIKRRRKA